MNAIVLVIVGLVVLFFLAIAIGLIIYFVTRKSSPNNNGLTDLNKPNGGGPLNPPTCKCDYLDPMIPRPPRIPASECIPPIGTCESGSTQ